MARQQRLTFTQFYQLAEQLRTMKEQLERERPNRQQLCALLAQKCGFTVSARALDQACASLGLSYHQRRRGQDRYRNQEVFQLVFQVLRKILAGCALEQPAALKQAEKMVEESIERGRFKQPIQGCLPLEAGK